MGLVVLTNYLYLVTVPSISFHPFPSPHPSTCAHRWAGQPLGVFAMGVDVVDNDVKASPRSLPIAFRAFGRSNSVTSRQAHSTFQKSPKFAYLFKWTLYISRNPDIFLF